MFSFTQSLRSVALCVALCVAALGVSASASAAAMPPLGAGPNTVACKDAVEMLAWWDQGGSPGWQQFVGAWYPNKKANPPAWSPCANDMLTLGYISGPVLYPTYAMAPYFNDKYLAVADPENESIAIVKDWDAKGKPTQSSELYATAYAPAGIAVDNAKTLYASSNEVGSPSDPSGILVYAKGALTPTGFLTDSSATGFIVAAGVAVDKRGDVFWALNAGGGTARVDEFVAGQSTPSVLFSYSGTAGDVEIDRKNNLVVSIPSSTLGTGVIVYSLQSQTMIGGWPVYGTPASISLDANDEYCYVVDTTNNVVSQFEYPSGKLKFSGPVLLNASTPINPGSVMAIPPQKP